MAIRFSVQSGNFEFVDDKKIIKWITEVVKQHRKTVGNINYLFCGDEYMIEINRRYLNHDTYTDIITFDYVVGNLVSGDILISVDRVEENAVKYGIGFNQELLRVIVHGVLHLLGQNDKTDEESIEMRRLENESLDLWKEMFHEEQNI